MPGVFGEIIYMRGGYRHDLRSLLLDDSGNIGHRGKTESVWRSKFYQSENGDLYPTHGLAPLCMIAGINRTDHFKSLTSLASKSAGLLQRIKDLGGDTNVEIRMGDIVSTQIETEKGILISLIHDTTLPRPRSLDFEIQGTKSIWQGDNSRIYVEGVSRMKPGNLISPTLNVTKVYIGSSGAEMLYYRMRIIKAWIILC